MTNISVANQLSVFRREDSQEFDFGPFTVTLKRFTLADPKIKAKVESIQRKNRRLPAGVSTGLANEIQVFCEMALIAWTLQDDDGNYVPISQAPTILAGSKEGKELYFNMLSIATSTDAFDQVDDAEIDEEELKNS